MPIKLSFALLLVLLFTPPALAEAPNEALEPIFDDRAVAIASVISEVETRGDCTAKGASGETGCFQYQRATWAAYSKEIFGEVKEQTPENAKYVTEAKIALWLEEGYTARDVFLTWNQGHSGACRRGINRHGVSYDSCAYADKALRLLNS